MVDQKILRGILDSYRNPSRFKQKYKDTIRESLNKKTIDWDDRATLCSRSLLNAICFKESSRYELEKVDNLIYPPIGYYYSIFHLSMAMLRLEYSTDKKDLIEVGHTKLINLVDTNLISRKLVSSSFLETMKKLKELRESCNYQFGYQNYLEKDLKKLNGKVDSAFEDALSFIHQVLLETGTHMRLTANIGDGFGDDIIDSYVSKNVSESIWDYLILHGLTT